MVFFSIYPHYADTSDFICVQIEGMLGQGVLVNFKIVIAGYLNIDLLPVIAELPDFLQMNLDICHIWPWFGLTCCVVSLPEVFVWILLTTVLNVSKYTFQQNLTKKHELSFRSHSYANVTVVINILANLSFEFSDPGKGQLTNSTFYSHNLIQYIAHVSL